VIGDWWFSVLYPCGLACIPPLEPRALGFRLQTLTQRFSFFAFPFWLRVSVANFSGAVFSLPRSGFSVESQVVPVPR
jgi:hypothetical protein